jgi:hypothetical protein
MTVFTADSYFNCCPLSIGTGQILVEDKRLRCVVGPNDADSYHNAQICDYIGLDRRNYPWRPPLRMKVRAWMSHSADQLHGTAGFGFWNQPFMPGMASLRLPRSVWFFFSGLPNNMALAKGVPGHGWKAATFDASHLLFFALLPFAPVGFLLMRIPALYRRLWPIGQRALGVSEKLLPVAPDEFHTYELLWRRHSVDFLVDDALVHHTPCAPRGPLGFVAWIDNQYAIVTPQGRFRFGTVPLARAQWLVLESVEIELL